MHQAQRQEVFTPAFQLTRPGGLLSVIGTGTHDDWERQMAFGGLNYSWCLQTPGAYGQLSLSAGCLLTVWASDFSLCSPTNFLKSTLLLTKEERKGIIIGYTYSGFIRFHYSNSKHYINIRS